MRVINIAIFTSFSYFFGGLLALFAQQTQTIRGKVIDRLTQNPLPGASVMVYRNDSIIQGTVTNENGIFRIDNISIGNIYIKISYLGYQPYQSAELNLTVAKELIILAELMENDSKIQTVEISSNLSKESPVNEWSIISTRSFVIEEAQRYAASINDPARMAMGFAGVQLSQDNNNDIIIRGNSPVGLLWRLEGIDIPNPNHFARRGSTGGGISALSAQVLSNGDFSTGAFAAEYGNAFSGVFDLKFRKGNDQKHEFTARAGIIGLEISAEGPFINHKTAGSPSFLFNYRYSTLGILNQLGLRLTGDYTSNTFQDLSFNIFIPAQKYGNFSLFGFGGLSSELTTPPSNREQWLNFTDNQQIDFRTNTGVIGITHTLVINKKSFLRTVIGYTANQYKNIEDSLSRINLQPIRYLDENYMNSRQIITSQLNYKFNNQINFRTGFIASKLNYNILKSSHSLNNNEFQVNNKGKGSAFLFQPYFQFRIRLKEKLIVQPGLHILFLSLNRHKSVEPRLSFQYQLNNRLKLNWGYGYHGQIQPLGTYYTQIIDSISGQISYPNRNLNLTRAHQFVLGVDYIIFTDWHLKIEPYYQLLTHVPADTQNNITYWSLNERDGFANRPLTNIGTGINYGIDLTIEKFFSNHWFLLNAISLYNSTYGYRNSTISKPTRYNGRFVSSLLAGKEIVLKRNKRIELGTRFIWSGGLRYTPIDVQASQNTGIEVRDESMPFSQKAPNYFRTDIRIALHRNHKKTTSILALDIQNLTNRLNILTQTYNPLSQQLVWKYQTGLLPVVSYRLDFSFNRKS